MPRNYYRAEINRLSAELLRERQRRERAETYARCADCGWVTTWHEAHQRRIWRGLCAICEGPLCPPDSSTAPDPNSTGANAKDAHT